MLPSLRERVARNSEESWDRHIDTNLKGPFLCSQEFGPGMVERKLGKIINIVDWAAERPYTGYIPYCVSKAGLICLTKALAKTLAPHVQVNAVGPGPVLLPEDMPKEERDAVLKAFSEARRIASRRREHGSFLMREPISRRDPYTTSTEAG